MSLTAAHDRHLSIDADGLECSARSASRPPTAARFGRWFRETGWRHVVGVFALFFALFPVWFVVIAAFSESVVAEQPDAVAGIA